MLNRLRQWFRYRKVAPVIETPPLPGAEAEPLLVTFRQHRAGGITTHKRGPNKGRRRMQRTTRTSPCDLISTANPIN